MEAIKINGDSGRKVVAHAQQAASAATIVALAASKVTPVADGDLWCTILFSMVAALMAVGKLQSLTCNFQSIRYVKIEIILDIYTKRTGADRAEIAELTRMTTFLKSEDALKYGFVDRMVPALPKPGRPNDTCTCADCRAMAKPT